MEYLSISCLMCLIIDIHVIEPGRMGSNLVIVSTNFCYKVAEISCLICPIIHAIPHSVGQCVAGILALHQETLDDEELSPRYPRPGCGGAGRMQSDRPDDE